MVSFVVARDAAITPIGSAKPIIQVARPTMQVARPNIRSARKTIPNRAIGEGITDKVAD